MGKMQIPKICTRCGANFTAQKITTQYCSHECARLAYKDKQRQTKLIKAREDIANYGKPPIFRGQKNAETIKLSLDDLSILNCKEFLSVLDVSILMGVTRNTINKYCANGKLKCIKMNRRIFIRRRDLDEIFETASAYQVATRAVKPKEKMSNRIIQQIESDASVSKGAIHRRAGSNGIPKITFQGRLLYSKTHIDNLYEREDIGLTSEFSFE